MIDSAKTETGSRPDLAALPVNTPIGYIGEKIFPTVKVAQKAGDIAYSALIADGAAQTGRTLGAAPTATVVGESTFAFTATENIKRYVVPYSSVPLFGGVAGSDRVGAAASKRSVANAIETAQIAELIDAQGATDISSAIVDGLTSAANDVARYAGKLAFVCSVGQYRWLIQQTEIKNLLGRSFGGLTAEQVMSLNQTAFKAMLQGIFAFDEVLIFDEQFIPTDEDTAAVVKISDGADDISFAMQPEYGRTVAYWPEAADGQFEINSFADDDIRGNVYDATSWLQVKELNAGAKSLVQLGNSATTV